MLLRHAYDLLSDTCYLPAECGTKNVTLGVGVGTRSGHMHDTEALKSLVVAAAEVGFAVAILRRRLDALLDSQEADVVSLSSVRRVEPHARQHHEESPLRPPSQR